MDFNDDIAVALVYFLHEITGDLCPLRVQMDELGWLPLSSSRSVGLQAPTASAGSGR